MERKLLISCPIARPVGGRAGKVGEPDDGQAPELGVGVGRLARATAVAGFARPEPSRGMPTTVGKIPSINRPGVTVGKGIMVGGVLTDVVG